MELVEKLQQGKMLHKVEYYKLENDGTFLYKNRIYVPNSQELRIMALKEMHNVPYVGHSRYQKIVAVVKRYYFWSCTKKDIAKYIAICMECKKFNTKHRYPVGLLQPFPISEWKWEVVTMDFITGLPRTNKQHDSSWWWWKILRSLPILFPCRLLTRKLMLLISI